LGASAVHVLLLFLDEATQPRWEVIRIHYCPASSWTGEL